MRNSHPSLTGVAGRARAAGLMIAAAALIAACGSSSPSGSGGSRPATGGGGRTTRATLATATVPGYGRVLATAAGRPVFLFTADPRGSSRCSGACASTWSPLTAHGRPVAGAGVSASLLSSFKRAGGTTQVLYNGHALYTHAGGSPGSYAGMASDGGVWYLVSSSGAAIKTTKGGGY